MPFGHLGLALSVTPAIIRGMAENNTISPDLLAILVCPVTRSPLHQEGDELVAAEPAGAGLRYPIREGIPILLPDEAVLPAGVESLAAFREKVAGLAAK